MITFGPIIIYLQGNTKRTPIEDLASLTEEEQLKRGDHICWHRPYVIWHHAIVLKVDVPNERLQVIHWGPTGKAGRGICGREMKIYESEIDLKKQEGDLYRIDYSKDICEVNPVELVIARADCERSNKKFYDLLNNNCESFATYCRQGVSDSQQRVWFWGKVVEWLGLTGVRVAITIARILVLLLSEIIEEAIEGDPSQNTNSTENADTNSSNDSNFTTQFMPFPLSGESGQGLESYSCPNIYQLIGVGILALFELGVFVYHLIQYTCQWKKGNFFRRDYCLRILNKFMGFLLRTICSSIVSVLVECRSIHKFSTAVVITFTTLGGLAGALLGQLLLFLVCYVRRRFCKTISGKCITATDFRVIPSLDYLGPGAHIKYQESRCSSYQHAVVLSINSKEEFKLVSYSKGTGRVENDYRFGSLKRVYKMLWRRQDICSNDEVTGRAVDMLRAERRRLDEIREQSLQRAAEP